MNFTWNLSHLIPLISSPRVDFHLVKGGILYHCGTHMVVPWDEFHLLSEDFSEHFSDKFSSIYRILFAMLSNTWGRFLKPLKYKIYSKEAKITLIWHQMSYLSLSLQKYLYIFGAEFQKFPSTYSNMTPNVLPFFKSTKLFVHIWIIYDAIRRYGAEFEKFPLNIL